MIREKYTIGDGQFETPVYDLRAEKSGKTTVVVCGQHGNEVCSPKAGDLIRLWEINRGRIIVIPRANLPACKAQRRSAHGHGDMNRMFPRGKVPGEGHARAVWELIVENDADYVFDLHRSKGIYRGSPSGVGMAIYPTPRARSAAKLAMKDLNKNVVPKGVPHFRMGNDQTGANPLLSHKVGGELEPPVHCWLVETTSSHGNSMYARTQQLERSVERILYHATDKNQVVLEHNHHEQEPDESVLDEYDERPSSGGLTDEQEVALRVIETIQDEFDIPDSAL